MYIKQVVQIPKKKRTNLSQIFIEGYKFFMNIQNLF